ncbi:MAG: hypothetical protein JWR53_751 [Glaciihabitans sp.]|nr:hypothetical protein [Glaciihabitans sp.]
MVLTRLKDTLLLRLQDSNLDLTAPKAVVLPLHQGGPRNRAPQVCQMRGGVQEAGGGGCL